MKNNINEMYETFKMQWMINHGITMADICLMAEQWKADCEDEISFIEYLEEYGFGGTIWPCFEEFVESDLPILEESHLI